ncbi:uncharacterized protein LOC111411393 [Olea europaea var. sylvestris]|uniref:uncharacterized protein LOC111411393 n=1 Tax=Olea europaea var. sylvestris TaxID=158386 RepID=UPI000C1D1BC5|nr:uncharacterized protein LOC111411393 [Olea europaea var. sylvestris]
MEVDMGQNHFHFSAEKYSPSRISVTNVQHDNIHLEPSVPNNNAADTPIFDVGAAPLDEMLEDPLHGTDANNIADVDKGTSSHSRSSDTYQWITSMNTSNLVERQIFFSKKELYSKIRVLALHDNFQFKVSRSNFRRNAHRHATTSVIVEHILEKLDNLYRSYDPTAIARHMECEFGVKISYQKAHRGKVVALHMLYCIPGYNFQKLLSYCHVLGESNPRTVNYIEVDACNMFYYFFRTFGASIRGNMHYLRPVIYVDSSHLKGPYKGTLLLATDQDANKQIYPLAWEIVDVETNRSWTWFLSNLKELMEDSDELVFVFDREKVFLMPLLTYFLCLTMGIVSGI